MEETQLCPHCAEEVKAEAIVCKHCGRQLKTAKKSPILTALGVFGLFWALLSILLFATGATEGPLMSAITCLGCPAGMYAIWALLIAGVRAQA